MDADRNGSPLARGVLSLLVAVLAVGGLARCSFSYLSGFSDCNQDADCPAGRLCFPAEGVEGENYCLPPPPGCTGLADAGLPAVLGPVDGGQAVPLGLAFNMTTNGMLSTTREQQVNALRLALDEINAQGIAGRPVTLHLCDTRGDVALLRRQVAFLTGKVGAPAVFVPSSAQVLVAANLTVPRG